MSSGRWILVLILFGMIAFLVDAIAMEVMIRRGEFSFGNVRPEILRHFDQARPRSPLVDKPARPGPFDEIQPGMTIEAVEQALGGPHTELLKLQSTGQVDPDTRIWKKDGMTIVVFFNKEGRVIGKAVR